MHQRTISTLMAGAMVLSLAPAVFAHGGGESMAMNMTDAPRPEEEYPPTYFTHPEHRGVIYAHIAFMTLGWVFALPVAVMLSLARSRYTLPAQFVFLAFNAVGVLLSSIYNASTPDLYPNNAHHKIGWIATWVLSAQVLVSVVGRLGGAFQAKKADFTDSANGISSSERRAFIPVATDAIADHHDCAVQSPSSYRMSDDSGQGTEPNTESLRSNSVSTRDGDSLHRKESYEEDEPNQHHDSLHNYDDDDDDDLEAHLPSSLRRHAGRLQKLTSKLSDLLSSRVWKGILLYYNVVDRTSMILGFVAFATGVVTIGRFFEGHAIFNGLAHWIKGGVFFWLGLFTLGRWAGCFGEVGWAWNVRPKTASSKWRASSEFVESFLIFFYGATNIFLEHLANAGKAYSPVDLEHISITVLFLGGGLCGMLVESTRIRDLLNTTVSEAIHEYPENNYSEEERMALRAPKHYEFSINPIPALVILLTGIMMSSHTQETAISSMVHRQWGNLLAAASFARGFTYLTMYLKPPQSILPSRPPTELLASFGLIAGGIIFMASSADVVNGMIHYQLDEMFIYTVTMGLVGMLMAWEILVIALKGWAVRKELGRPAGSYEVA